MLRRHRIAWKLSVPVLIIVSAVILGAGFLGSYLSRSYALDSAREFMRFNSTSIRSSIDGMMMSNNRDGVMEMFEEMSRRSTTYMEIGLIAHPSGTVAVSRLQVPGTVLSKNDQSCRLCHTSDETPPVTMQGRDEVIASPAVGHLLLVVTPILNQRSCRNAACHVHTDAGMVLGFLRTEYSLASFKERMNGLNVLLGLSAIVAIVLATGAMLIMFRWFLALPLRRLVRGIGKIADGDLSFRYSSSREDEIGLVKDSFNEMAERIQSQQKRLREAAEYLEGIVENTADMVITVNRAGTIQTFNRGAEEALGYEREKVIGTRIETLFADPQEREKALTRLQTRDNVSNWRTRFKTRDGDIRHVLLTLSRLKDRKGHIIGTLGISKDITVEMDLQKKLIQSEQAAAIGRAVTAIQHAIKNMLNTLKGGLYIVQVGHKKKQDERIVEGCVMIDEGLERIVDLSMHMLKYAREWKVERQPVDVKNMIRTIAAGVDQASGDNRVVVYTDIDNGLPDILCDPRLIHMGLMDIVSNAVDACGLREYEENERPEISIRVYREVAHNDAVIEIRDNGAGMSQEVVDNVFTPFFSTKKITGTGLGLALTKRIIDLHNGEIVVESEPEKGALFRITLPIDGNGKKSGGYK